MSSPVSPPRIAVVLAAGKGTRMISETPKVLHRACGRPLLAWVLDAARAAGCERILVVVGHRADEVRATFADATDLGWVLQREQLGTGHALAQAADQIEGEARVLVLSGDVPLVSPDSLRRLIEAADGGWGSMAIATVAEPGSLGRVIADGHGRLRRIVEARDALPDELAVRTVNAGIYVLPAPEIFARLARVTPHNAQGELYLTDAVTAAAGDGEHVALVELGDSLEASGVNDRFELARVGGRLVERKIARLAHDGTTFLAPGRVLVEESVEVGVDSVVHADVTLLGSTNVGAGVVLHAGAWLRDTTVDDNSVIEPYSVLDGATVGRDCRVGPFARLRPGAVLDDGARVGNFVEVKNARLGAGAKANHLAYLGDAHVGEGANIGAGVVTCNYDGVAKHRTEIGARAFVGSDTMLVAPVKVGDDATTGAGSVITRDVPDGALAVERAPQRTVEGWSRRRRRPEPPEEG
ncbi:MAG: bifunctional UDP-N-acetylglucosamine diphosphorylase/glucosamine-1-phosphate N-acetyltransferase GlmU [Acidobacteria bacterium]|nr:bifunctional UDP-N-acetylglucosamine diphosphorylase/glucosamine-1-phosphate N-acetyltransferase GlmU [Acidobacteriota bacterium]MCB9377887.1 bifunctional UDP-N-acetylglucosamine diphosphorylase/glucosamine-1-phosphate N-acetyltransferase GlmU [Holophagales bacterium]